MISDPDSSSYWFLSGDYAVVAQSTTSQEITPDRYYVFALSVFGLLVGLTILFINSYVKAGVSSVSKEWLAELAKKEPARAVELNKLLENPSHLSNCIHTLNIIGYCACPASAISAIHQFNIYDFWVSLMLFVLIFFILLFTRAIPRGYGLQNPEKAALRFTGFIRFEVALVSPLTRLINRLAAQAVRKQKTGEEIQEIENQIETEETLNPRSSIENELEAGFGDRTVREVMIPRLDIIGISVKASLPDLANIAIKTGFSRLPVYREDLDHIVGVLYVKDLLSYLKNHTEFNLLRHLRPAYFVPESKGVEELFRELQSRRVHIAIVVDEYGGTAGLVTIEDLLEEIVGEIHDEYDKVTQPFVRLGMDEIMVDAQLKLEEVNQFFNTRWESDEVDTIGGLVLDKLGRMPSTGDEVILDRQGNARASEDEIKPDDVALIVMSVSGQRIGQVRLLHYVPRGEDKSGSDSIPVKIPHLQTGDSN
jgi:CBS domain containing-hemolysin-like protein